MRDDFDGRDDEVPFEDEDLFEDGDGQPGLPWPPAPASGQPPHPAAPPHRWRRHGVALVVTAVSAAAAGFLIVIAVRDLSASPAAAQGSPPSASPAPSGGNGNLLPPGTGGAIPAPGPGQSLDMEIGGRVAAVSPTSITLAARGQRVTAAVTGATKVTGKVSTIGGVKPGDLVSVQITGTDGKLTATAIQDPASLP